MFRILAAYLQVTALAQAVPIEWPEAVLAIFRGMETISSPSLSMISVDCAIAKDDPLNGLTGAFYKKFLYNDGRASDSYFLASDPLWYILRFGFNRA